MYRQQGVQFDGCLKWNHRTCNSSDIVSVFESPLNGKACRAKYPMFTPEGLSNLSAGMYYLIGLQRLTGGLSCVLVVSSLAASVVDGSKSFSFPGSSFVRLVSSATPGSVLLVHDFTHDKSVPYLFSTPQARSQQQFQIVIHLLKKLAPVNDISGVLYLVDPMWPMWSGQDRTGLP